jgi:quinol-cytochrome oxidoreductase complex cytochrome b subunit/coenzyme F420-reducing hydrogenase delta subunit
MLQLLQNLAQRVLGPQHRFLRWSFSETHNPMNHLGSLSIFFCWVVLVSGIWLLIFFRTSVTGAFESVQYLAEEQWYLGGVMRSLHRYASDALIVTIFLHIVKEFSRDTYRVRRWFSWIAGIPLVWIVFLLGITGYWLVWDELAQYVALTSSELLDSIPVFTNKMAANFLRNSLVSDRFFTLMAFLHLIGLPIFLVFGIWLHVFRLSRPGVNPTRKLMAGTLVAILVVSVVFPAPMQEKADLAIATQTVQLDWFYLHLYPLVQKWSPGWVWVLLVGISGLIFFAPWLPRGKYTTPARVDLDNCNGCRRCADDCPYDAVQMRGRTDGKRYDQEAVVDPDLCVSCGICVGACPTATPFRTRSALIPGIDLPDRAIKDLKQAIDEVTCDHPLVLAFACQGSSELAWLRKNGKAHVEVACSGQIPPSYLDYVLSRNLSDRILVSGCDGDCRYRFGTQWTEQRIRRERDPNLRRRVGAHRIAMAWASPWSDAGGIAAQWNALEQSARKECP